MLAFYGSLSVIPWILFAQASWTMDAVPATSPQPRRTREVVEVLDRGDLFGHDAERRATQVLRRVSRGRRTPILIETIRSVGGAWIADVARRHARKIDGDQLYILVAADESDVAVVGAIHGPASRLTEQEREAIRRAFLGPLRAGRPDEALDRGLGTIKTVIDSASSRYSLGFPGALIPSALLMMVLFVWWAWERVRPRSDRVREPANFNREAKPATAVISTTPPAWHAAARERASVILDQPAKQVHEPSIRGEGASEPFLTENYGVAEMMNVGETAMRAKNSKIYMTRPDRDRLASLLERPHNPELDGYFHSLRTELDRAEVVDAEKIPPDVVTMNSKVCLVDVADSEEDEYTLVFPSEADVDAGKISVMAPLGTAMLGYRVGDVFDWDVPMGRKRWRIARMVYQPEAAGNYNL